MYSTAVQATKQHQHRHGSNMYVRTMKHHHSTAHSATVIHVPFSFSYHLGRRHIYQRTERLLRCGSGGGCSGGGGDPNPTSALLLVPNAMWVRYTALCTLDAPSFTNVTRKHRRLLGLTSTATHTEALGNARHTPHIALHTSAN